MDWLEGRFTGKTADFPMKDGCINRKFSLKPILLGGAITIIGKSWAPNGIV